MITLHELTLIRAPIDRVFQLSLSVEVHLRGNTHFGEETVAVDGHSGGILGSGDEVTWRARHFGIRQRLTSKITRYDRPHAFQDTMLRGAFHSIQHDHFFRERPPSGGQPGITEMRDVFRFAAPFGPLGLLAERLVLARYMRALLVERNRVIQRVAESDDWRQYL